MIFVEIDDYYLSPVSDEELKKYTDNGCVVVNIDEKTNEKTVVFTPEEGWVIDVPTIEFRKVEEE